MFILVDMKKLAMVISRVLDPIIVLPAILLLAVGDAFVNGERILYLVMLLAIDVVLPGLVLAYFIQKGRVLSGWDVTKRAERVPLFMFVVVAHLVGVMLTWFLGRVTLALFLLSFWFLTLVYAAVTLVWKISVHAGVMSAMVTFLVLTHSRWWAAAYALVLLVIWARVFGKYHRLSQALVGGAIPILVLPACFWWLGII